MVYHFIFDMDGTLIDTEFEVSKITSALAASEGYALAPETVHRLFSGYAPKDKFRGIASLLNGQISEDRLTEMSYQHEALKKDLYLKDDVPLVPGIADLLNTLQDLGCFLSVATSSPEIAAVTALEKVNISPFFERRIFGSDSTVSGKKKPAPDVYLHAMKSLGHSAEETIAIEDSVAGVISAKAAGIQKIIAYLDPHFGTQDAAARRGQELVSAGATAVIRTLDAQAFLFALEEPQEKTQRTPPYRPSTPRGPHMK